MSGIASVGGGRAYRGRRMPNEFRWACASARRLAAASIFGLAAAVAVTPLPGEARTKQSRPSEVTAPREAGEPIMAIVSVKSQQITFYDADGWTHRAPISTGLRGRETPAGVFSIVQKNADHRSNLYDDAWMPHMQRLTWNGIALHGGELPGYPASKGCVRMPFGFAERMFERTRIGMRVIVSPADAAPVEITHPVLLKPDPQALAAAPARLATLEREAAEAARQDEEAKRASAKVSREAASLTAALRRLEAAKNRADGELASAVRRLAAAKDDGARERAEAAKTSAEAKAAEAAAKLATARADAKSTLEAAASAKDTIKAAASRKTATAQAAKDAKLATEPVSIYISRAAQKLYVRRNTQKPWPDGGVVFDSSIEVPVSIRNPDRPIGTHIFTAMARSESGLKWTAVSIDSSEDAKSALDRISIPQEVLDRIGPTALPRSSIVISDEPLSRETNYRTEFVAVLSNQPQGGFVTRKPTPPPAVASAGSWGGGSWGGGGFGFFDPPPRYQERRRGSREVQKDWWW